MFIAHVCLSLRAGRAVHVAVRGADASDRTRRLAVNRIDGSPQQVHQQQGDRRMPIDSTTP
jgi:hypothetical protein